jgi:YesN/AraC family two-component response regulator
VTATGNGQGIEAGRYGALDDCPEVLEAFAQILVKDYNIPRPQDGQTALDLIERRPIDLILLDLVLPGLDGLEILRRVRAIRPHVPVIVVTGHSSHDVAIKAANLDVYGYLVKRFDVQELKDEISAASSQVTIPRICSVAWSKQNTCDVFEAAQRMILDHYAERLTVKKIAKQLDTSPRQLLKIFRKRTGLSIKAYLIRVRISAAVSLVIGTDLPFKAIASNVGYESLSNFYKHFKYLTGMTPLDYRKLAVAAGC